MQLHLYFEKSMIFEIVLNLFYGLFSIFISVIFWLKDSNKGCLRLAVSLHSILLLITLILSMYVGLELHIYNNKVILISFNFLIFLSVLSIALSVRYFRGSQLLFFFHLWNIFALALTIFVGGMSLTNDWL
jgi:hypothetical protein